MAEFLTEHSLYVVLLIIMICWIGIVSYLFWLDKKITMLEKKLK